MRSASGQFIVHADRTPGPGATAFEPGTNRNLIGLELGLVTVSADRIKQLLSRELEATAPARGKIYLALHPTGSADETVTVTAGLFKDGWEYRVDLPDVVERARYVRALVQVLLLEMANRQAGAHSAEIPPWLTEGLAQQLLASNELEILLPPPDTTVNGIRVNRTYVSLRRDNPLEQAHRQLCAHTPLTFEQLSWPAPEQLTGPAGELYRSSAQVFVQELLQMPEGRACLRAMLADLPQFYNWHLAFLRAYRAYFTRPLEVEKWWALQLAHFTGRELSQNWPADESWQKLEETLRPTVQVRAGANELPLLTNVTLQTIIRDWPDPRQTEALQEELRQLELLRLRVTLEPALVVDAYRQTLASYLHQREHPGLVLPFRKQAALRHAAEEALKQLDALDARRAELRSKSQSPPLGDTKSGTNTNAPSATDLSRLLRRKL